jgi:SAM-dependent methyltransferase
MPEPAGTRFGQVALTYHRMRPSTPPEAVDWLTAGVTDTVVELGAGNGQLTELFVERGLRVHAIEPDARMRAVLGQRCPGVLVLDGSAERIPHEDNSVCGVFAASAWHWFEPKETFAEIGRVLRIGGVLGVMWNLRDETEPWVVELDRVMGRPEQRPRRHVGAFSVPEGVPFTPETRYTVEWTWSITPEELVESMTSYSYVLAMSEDEREERLADARKFVDTHPALAGRSLVDVPIRTVCYRTVRV